MQRWIGLFTFLGMMTWCTSAAMAVTQQLTPTADVWLEENNPTANHGTDKELRARGAGGDREWVIYHVDVSGWSDGPVTNAMLQVFVTDEDALGGKVQVYLVQKSWAEGTANWSNLAAFVDTTASLGQFQPTAPGSYAVNVTSAVQNWISSGTNFGLALVPEVGAEHTRYTSRDFDNVDARPSLWVSSDILSPNVSLGVDKVADVTTPTVADSVRYTVTVQNKSASTATGVQLTDQLPGGLTFLTSGVTQGSYNPVDGLWNVGSLGGLSTATLFIVSQVDSGTIGDTIVNTASVSALDQSDFNSFDDADSVAITVIASGPDLAITKTVDSETVVPGQLITYTVGVRNVGTQTTTNLWVDDALPAGVTYSDYTATQGNYAFGAQSWLVGTLAPGDSASLFLDATVDAATEGQTITNVAARGSHTGTDLNPSNDADSASVVVLSADLAVTKSVDNAAPFEGDNIEYLVTVENLGPTETSSARITDVLPAGLTFVSDSTTAGTYDDVNGRWQIGDLTAGTVDSLWITAQVDDGTAGDTITNTAAVETSVAPDAVPGNDSASVDVIVRSADLELVMSGSEPTPEENETFLLSYQVNNAGPDDAFGVSVGLTIPSGLTVDSVDLVDGGFDGGSGIWTIGSIANGDSANLDLSVTVDPGTAGSVFNPGATLGIRSPGDPNPGNDSGSFEITVQSADLVVTKAVSNPRPNEGDTVIYTVTVENLGPFDATGVQLIDQLPAGVSFQFDSPSQGTYDDGSGVWDVGDVNVGEIKTLALLSSVDAATALQAIVNRADVLATSPVDPVAANDSMAVGMTVLGADLSLTKVSNKATAFVNTSVTFTIDVANAGPDSATNVVVVDQIPSPLIYQGDSPSHGDYDQISGDWDIGAIAPGDTATLVVTTLVPGGAAGAVVTNVASISTVDQADTNPGAEADSVTVSVNNALPLELADLEIVMAVDNATPSVGDTVQWELEISNAGPDPATSVTVSDVLPAGLTYSGSGTTTGSYNPSNGIWTIGTIATGVADTLYLYATVDESAAGLQITNNATASANQPDPSGTASDNASINVPVADLELTKTVDQTLPTVGDSLVYTLTLVNLGGDATGGVFVADTIPAGLSVTSSSATRGSYSPATGLWSVGPMAAADTVSLDIFADVDPAAAGNTLWNVASIFASGEGDSAAANNVDSAAVRVTYADLQIESLVSNGVPDEGDTITWTTTLENLGLDATTTTAVTAAIPAGLTYVTHVASSGSFASGTGAWDVGPVSATPETLTVTLTVDAATGGTTIPLAASVTSDLYDPTPANDNDSIDVNVLVPTGLVVSGFQTARVVNPGQSNVALWSLSLANSTGGSVSVSEIRFDNRTTGIGTQNQLDAELGTVRLHQDDGSGTFEPAQDPSIATGTVAAGEVVFGGLGLTLPSFAAGIYHVVVDVPQDGARDGDVLDVRLPSGASFDAGGANVLGTFPIDPAGGLTVNGVVAAQVGVTPLPDAGVEKGTTALAFAATLPPNGYAPDMLEELRVFNRGTAVVADLSAVKAWSDGGDGAFDAGAGDDTFLGLLTFGVGTWDLTGLTVAIPTTGLDLWVSADLAIGGTAGRTLQFAIPATNGLVTSGGNSGPLDGATTASRTVSITEPPTPIRAVEVPQVLHTLLPGAKSEIVYRFLVINEGTQAETLETITFTNTSTGAPSATQADLDQNWRPLEVQRVRSADVTGVGGSGVGDLGLEGNEVRTLAKSFADGTLEVDLAEVLAPGDSALFRVFSGAALTARDGDQLDLRIEAATDLKFTNPVNLQGVFPLDPAGTHTVDGMAAAQLAFFDIPPSLLTGSTRNLVADFLVPANGYENDTMLRLDLVNLGDAEPGTDIDKIELWRDGDGSGDFNPGLDTLLGEMLFTGDRWERTGLSSPVVAGSGLRLFVTADVAELATAGRELRLAVAGPPEPGIGMLSDNDGPIDGAIGGSGATISTVDRVTFAPQNLGPRVVSPGEVGVPLLTVSAENTYSVEKTLTALTVTNTSTGAGSTDDLDREISLLTLWADDGDGTFEGAPQDTALATSFFESGAASFGAFGWSLAAAEVRRLFVTGEVSGPSATDGDVLAAEISGPTSMQFSDVTSLTASWPLDSNAAATVDGTVAAQFTNLGAPATTLGSGEGPSLALDVVLPSNGYLVDELNSFTVTNLGDATDADLAEVRLWRDGGDGVFDAGVGDDADLGLLAAFGNDWANPSLSESIPAAGARVFVSITA